MALRRPSKHSIDLYNQLVENQNKVRKQLRKIHKHAEETLGAGRLPALVIPKSAHKIRSNHFSGLTPEELRRRLKAYWGKYQDLKRLFANGMDSYLKETVFNGYKELWSGENGIGELPEGKFGRYSKEQIAFADEKTASVMKLYNQLFTRGVDFFMALLYTNKILDFKVIYDELHNIGGRGYSYIEQQSDFLKVYNSPKARAELVERAKEVMGEYRHSERAKKRAKQHKDKANAKLSKELDTPYHSEV